MNIASNLSSLISSTNFSTSSVLPYKLECLPFCIKSTWEEYGSGERRWYSGEGI
jgi:hypothetical protein